LRQHRIELWPELAVIVPHQMRWLLLKRCHMRAEHRFGELLILNNAANSGRVIWQLELGKLGKSPSVRRSNKRCRLSEWLARCDVNLGGFAFAANRLAWIIGVEFEDDSFLSTLAQKP
jgi:hypothetical protein